MSDSVNSTAIMPPTTWMAWLVCLSAGLFFLYEFFQLNLFDVINESLRHEFNLDAAQLSWMSSTYVWANILLLLPAGVILDKYSARRVILCAMSLCVFGTIGFALATSFAYASFFHALTGVGNAFCFLACIVLVARWFPQRRQALVVGCIVTMAFVGGMLAHTPLAYLSQHYGWRHALLIDGILGCVILVWIWFFVKDKPMTGASAGGGSVKSTYMSGFISVLANKQNWLAGIYTSCLNLPIMVLCALWGASYLQEVHQLNSLSASNTVSLLYLGSIIGCPLMGWLSDYIGRRKPVMLLGVLATLLMLLPLFIASSLSTMLLGIIFFSLGLFTSTQVISYPLIGESNNINSTGVATGMASVIIMGGGGIAQIVFGMLMRSHAQPLTQEYSVADFQFAMWMFPITIGIALLAILFIRETYCTRLTRSIDTHD